MNLIEEISIYIPGDEVEKSDKEAFLQFLSAFGTQAYDRQNLVGHITATAWVTNAARNKVLMCFHNLYQVWTLPGGHSDGNVNLAQVAVNEVREETGLTNLKINEKILGLSALCVNRHLKRGKIVPAHMHYDVQYLIEADETENLTVAPLENSNVKWIENDEMIALSREEHLIPTYHRIMEKLQRIE